MTRHCPHARTAAVVAALVTFSGCTAMDGFVAPGGRERPREASVPLAERVALEPLSPNRFELEGPTQSVIGEPQIVFTRADDTFSDLAREYGLGFDELVAANPGVDPWLPGAGVPVLLPTQYVLPDVPREGIVLNVAAKRLYYFPPAAEGEPAYVLTYPIGIGRVGWETPVGQTVVVTKARDPHWYPPLSVREEHAAMGDPLPAIVPPGPENPLGHRVLKLDMPGYLIHGTNQPYGVGMRVSHGCVRLYPENIETLYELVGPGETVRIVNEPYLAGWRGDDLYFEGHAPLADDPVPADDRMDRVMSGIKAGRRPFDAAVAASEARTIAADARGVPIRVLRRDVDEVFERARLVQNTVEPDPDLPTLAEVREMLDAPAEDAAEDDSAVADE